MSKGDDDDDYIDSHDSDANKDDSESEEGSGSDSDVRKFFRIFYTTLNPKSGHHYPSPQLRSS